MFFRKKNPQGNLRRRFHHLLISKRKTASAPSSMPRASNMRTRRAQRFLVSPQYARLRRILLFITIIAATLGSSYLVFFSSFFTISKITLEKNGEAVTQSALAPFLDKMKGKSLVFLNTAQLEQELEQTFRNEILLVRVSKSYPHRLVVKIDEYPAVLNLRVLAEDKTQKFIVNQIGYALFENTEQKDLPILTVRLPKALKVKSVVIDPQKLTPITDAYKKFTGLFGMKITEGEWKKVERELHLKTEKNFFVMVDLTAQIDDQLIKLKRALPQLDIYREPLEYIDLRIAGVDTEKVIFKRKK